jgi:hypothetical protein
MALIQRAEAKRIGVKSKPKPVFDARGFLDSSGIARRIVDIAGRADFRRVKPDGVLAIRKAP